MLRRPRQPVHLRSQARRLAVALCAVLTTAAALTGAVVTVAAGPATAATDHVPLGHLDALRNVRGGVEAVGWDADYDSPTKALVTFAAIDHHGFFTTLANRSRPDVAKALPQAGAAHGFDYVVPVPTGQHVVCISAVNLGQYVGHLLGCQERLFGHNPYGYLDFVTTRAGAVRAVGWAFDPENYRASLSMVISVDGVTHTVAAGVSRPDVAAKHPFGGPLHGFDATIAAGQGPHTVCARALNLGIGYDTEFGCRTVTVDDSPMGYLDYVDRYHSQLHVAGWTADRSAPSSPVAVHLTVDGVAHALSANQRRDDVARAHPEVGAMHGYSALYTVAEGSHTVCVTYTNIGLGKDRTLACKSMTLALTPTAYLAPAVATRTGATVSGWATDPDSTTSALAVQLTVDGAAAATVIAQQVATSHSGHAFTASLRMRSGAHTICAVGVNAGYGTHNSAASCQHITLVLSPMGYFDTATRVAGSTDIAVTGWALDPDTSGPLHVAVTVDGAARPDLTASVSRPDVEKAYPGWGAAHGYSARLAATGGEHTVCMSARNVGAGSDHSEGCKLVAAVHFVAPSAPTSVHAVAGYGTATVSWTKPASDGGAPWTKYVVTASSGGHTATASASATSVTVTGLATNTSYTFLVQAVNAAGASAGARTAAVTTQASPPPQTTPAPVSTSRYIRNVQGSSTTDLATMRAEGAADAAANPAGHAYLILLDIGGQDHYDAGVVLSAGVRFVSYTDLLRDVNAYLDGYHSAQLAGAPVTVALGTNNDMDVSYTTGVEWATSIVNPAASHAVGYAGMSIAGADDMEPGFRASYTETRSWLSGYLASTTKRFVFNGSADGCAWTSTGHSCNNGWTMAGLYALAAGAAPTRIVNLPQIYNTTMAAQWKYISLTGVYAGSPRIFFGGPLTEWTACVQTNSCGSLSGHTAWSALWADLQSDAHLWVSTLPYSTDLRVDR